MTVPTSMAVPMVHGQQYKAMAVPTHVTVLSAWHMVQSNGSTLWLYSQWITYNMK